MVDVPVTAAVSNPTVPKFSVPALTVH